METRSDNLGDENVNQADLSIRTRSGDLGEELEFQAAFLLQIVL